MLQVSSNYDLIWLIYENRAIDNFCIEWLKNIAEVGDDGVAVLIKSKKMAMKLLKHIEQVDFRSLSHGNVWIIAAAKGKIWNLKYLGCEDDEKQAISYAHLYANQCYGFNRFVNLLWTSFGEGLEESYCLMATK